MASWTSVRIRTFGMAGAGIARHPERVELVFGQDRAWDVIMPNVRAANIGGDPHGGSALSLCSAKVGDEIRCRSISLKWIGCMSPSLRCSSFLQPLSAAC